MVATNAFNLDCPVMIKIITNIMNTVNIATMNTSMSIKKLLLNDLNFDVGSPVLIAVYAVFLILLYKVSQHYWSMH